MSFGKNEYAVTIELTQPMLGTIATSKDIWNNFIAKKMTKEMTRELKKAGLGQEEIEQKIKDELGQTLNDLPEQDMAEQGLTTFYRTDNFNEDKLYRKPNFDGYFVREYMIRGFLKESSVALKEFGALKQLRNKTTKYVQVHPWAIKVAELDETLPIVERPLRAETPSGPRTCIARSHALPAGLQLSFEIHTWHESISAKLLKELLSYGQFIGLGANRGNSYGSFEVISFEAKK